jgi:hypothetical protein
VFVFVCLCVYVDMCLYVVEPSGFRVLGFFRCLRRYLSINETSLSDIDLYIKQKYFLCVCIVCAAHCAQERGQPKSIRCCVIHVSCILYVYSVVRLRGKVVRRQSMGLMRSAEFKCQGNDSKGLPSRFQLRPCECRVLM